VTINYFHNGLTPENFNTSKMKADYQIVTTNKDTNGTTFISAFESNDYPIYATQFHPEKNLFEFVLTKLKQRTPHTENAIKVAQYFANFFVGQARKSLHKFINRKEESDALIYNYSPVYTGKRNDSSFEQVYLFPMNGSADANAI
jgi:gamma-glutamyl hydrolase